MPTIIGEASPEQLTTTGTAVLDFGDSFGDFASVFVPQNSIASNVHVRAWFSGRTMASNDSADHALAGLWMKLVTTVAAVDSGFTIYAMCLIGMARGKFRVDWSWS